jgi:hypothetical protein
LGCRRQIAYGQLRFDFAAHIVGPLEVTVPPNAHYLRLECCGHGEQFALGSTIR